MTAQDSNSDIDELVKSAQHVVVIQADNPDADSLASSLALEHIIGDIGKKVTMYCGVDVPKYLRYLPGSDRVVNDLPKDFDLAIMVDCSTITLLGQLEKTNQIAALRHEPFVVIDHHASEVNLPFEHTLISDNKAVATGEVIYKLTKQYNWPLTVEGAEMLASSILSDSLGLTTEAVTANSVYALAELVEKGVDLAKLDARRRQSMSKPTSIIAYKAKLLERIEYQLDDQLAIVTIPWKEIETYSPLYNPGVLALEELRFAEGVKLAVALKTYPDGKVTGKLRCNYGCNIAGDLAAHFGGGGHPASAGFKTFGWRLEELKAELIKQTSTLLEKERS